MFGWGKHRKKRKKREVAAVAAQGAPDAANIGGEAVEAVANGCGCDISLIVAFTLVAGVPVLLWSI